MGIAYLKISAEKAYDKFNELIILGNEKRDEITKDYDSCRVKPNGINGEVIQKWNAIAHEWTNKSIEELNNVFVSAAELYEFRDARAPLGVSQVHIAYSAVSSNMKARIDKLIEFRNTVRDRFDIHLEIIQGHKITQTGNNNSTKIEQDTL